MSPEDIKSLLSTIDSTKTGYIQYKDMISFLHTYCEPSTFTMSQLSAHISTMTKNQKTTISELLTNKGYPLVLDISTFLK